MCFKIITKYKFTEIFFLNMNFSGYVPIHCLVDDHVLTNPYCCT